MVTTTISIEIKQLQLQNKIHSRHHSYLQVAAAMMSCKSNVTNFDLNERVVK
jgi:hypothetical protein